MHRPHLRYKYQTPRERTWTIHLISLEKVVKAIVLIVIGFKLLSLLGKDVHEWAVDFAARHRFAILDRFVEPALAKLIGVGDKQLKQFSVGAFVYAGILLIEGVGLWFQKRWAEYLTAIATALFIPVEIYEIYQKPTWVRFAALGINIFIVWYLSTRLRDEKVEGSNTTFVKICGITNVDDAKHAVKAGADALGFNFYEKSPRYILPQRAAQIGLAIGRKAFKVGVFVNKAVEEVIEIAEIAGLDAVQLHGDEDDQYVAELRKRAPAKLEIIRAFRLGGELRLGDMSSTNAVLLDTYKNGEFGGTGESFNWETAKEFVSQGIPVYLAGGLGPDNVGEAIATVHPFAVDACSCLEKGPGLKDHQKVRDFVKAAKGEV